jgi:hypothetical protein
MIPFFKLLWCLDSFIWSIVNKLPCQQKIPFYLPDDIIDLSFFTDVPSHKFLLSLWFWECVFKCFQCNHLSYCMTNDVEQLSFLNRLNPSQNPALSPWCLLLAHWVQWLKELIDNLEFSLTLERCHSFKRSDVFNGPNSCHVRLSFGNTNKIGEVLVKHQNYIILFVLFDLTMLIPLAWQLPLFKTI